MAVENSRLHFSAFPCTIQAQEKSTVCKDTDGVHIRERYRNVHDAYGIEQNERLRASEGR